MFRFLFDKDTWQELRESLTKNKLRTIITMIGVWWGILLLIGLLGSAKGIENKFSVQFGDYATNSVFIWGQTTSKAFKGFQQGRYPGLKLSQLEKIKNQVPSALFPEIKSEMSCPALVTALASRLDQAVTIDNGVMHMIGLAEIPMIVLFGPTNSEKFAPKYNYVKILDSKKIYNTSDIDTITVDEVYNLI